MTGRQIWKYNYLQVLPKDYILISLSFIKNGVYLRERMSSRRGRSGGRRTGGEPSAARSPETTARAESKSQRLNRLSQAGAPVCLRSSWFWSFPKVTGRRGPLVT